jgi:hypothetical protein
VLQHLNLSVLAVIKTHSICLQNMPFVSADTPNLFEMNHNLLVLIESKKSFQRKLKQLEDRATTLKSELATVRH